MTDVDPVAPVELAFLEALLADLERGQPAAIGSYLQRFPAAASFIQARFPSLTGSGPAVGAELIAGRFERIRRIGAGAQSVVYAAMDRQLGRVVALKLLRGAAFGRRLAMLQREARLASRLDDPRICTIHDCGVDGDIAWIAMRYVRGESFAERLQAEHRLRPDAAAIATLVRQIASVARALHACHEAGIVHRDIKPANLMCTDTGDVVVLDFGIARAVIDDGPVVTRTGEAHGTPVYMAPEQATAPSGEVDGRADVYALGVTLYELLAAKRPYGDQGATAGLDLAPVDLRSANAYVDRDLAAVVERAIERSVARRYASAAAFAADLEAVVERRPVIARRLGPLGRGRRWIRREPRLAAALGLAVLAVAAASSLWIMREREAGERAVVARIRQAESHDRQLATAWADFGVGRLAAACAAFDSLRAADADTEQRKEAVVGAVLVALRRGAGDVADAILAAERSVISTNLVVLLSAQRLRAAGQHVEASRQEELAPAPSTVTEWLLASAAALARSQQQDAVAATRTVTEAFDQALKAVLAQSGPPRLSAYAQLAQLAASAEDSRARRLVAETVNTIWPEDAMAAFWAGCALSGGWFVVSVKTGDEPSAVQRELLQTARDSFARAVALDAQFALASLNRGQCELRLGDLPAAHAAVKAALKIDPGLSLAHTTLGLILERMGDREAAIAAHRAAVALDPHGLAASHLAAALADAGRLDEAAAASPTESEDDASKMSRRRRAVDVYNRARLLDAMGKQDAAIVEFRKAIAIDATLAPAHNNLGTILHGQGDLTGAAEAYRSAVAIDSGHALAWLNLGLILRQQGRCEEALVALRRGHQIGSAKPGWKHESAAWIAECEAQLARSRPASGN